MAMGVECNDEINNSSSVPRAQFSICPPDNLKCRRRSPAVLDIDNLSESTVYTTVSCVLPSMKIKKSFALA